ncbi:MAG: Ku protein [Planctomycetota bacterium]|nr:Ku protein [Planctomycetota bacterium]
MAKKRTRKKTASHSKFRASWRGPIRFGLVSFDVQAINAQAKEQSDIHFHLLHAPDHQRIHYAKVCPKHGEVSNDEIVAGYEYAKGRYVEMEKDELDELRTKEERSLTVDAFVEPDQIDPIYFDGRMYYLVPATSAASEPYALLAAAMERDKRWGVGQVVFSGKEQLAVVRVVEGVMTMAMLNYEAEIRKPSEIKRDFEKSRPNTRNMKLAKEMISKWSIKDFDLGKYKDRYRQKVKAAIQAKKKGVEQAIPDDDEPESDVINLMDALRQSVSKTKAVGRGRRKVSHSRTSKIQHTKRRRTA